MTSCVAQVKVVSKEYWPLTLEFGAAGIGVKVRRSLSKTGILYVQEREVEGGGAESWGNGVISVRGKVSEEQ